MTRDTMISYAREPNGFIVTKNTLKATSKLAEDLISSGDLRISDKFGGGHGCRLRSTSA